MKKILMALMVLALMLGCAAALAEEEPIDMSAPDPDHFSGVWECDRASAEIIWEEEGYRVLIHWGSSAWEATTWEYACYYNAEKDTITSTPFGIKTELVFGDNGEEVSATVVYDDGVATFSIDEEGYMLWQDENENAGEALRFVQISDHVEVAGLDEEADG